MRFDVNGLSIRARAQCNVYRLFSIVCNHNAALFERNKVYINRTMNAASANLLQLHRERGHHMRVLHYIEIHTQRPTFFILF